MSDTLREPLNADRLADLLLRFHREPAQYRAQVLHAGLVRGNIDLVLRLALGRAVAFSDLKLREPATRSEIERAAVFYVQQWLFRPQATHYEVLGLPPNASPEAVREHFRLLMQLIHPDRQGAASVWPESYAARVNRAYGVLKNPESRAAYDRSEAATLESKAAKSARTTGAPQAKHIPQRAPVPRRPPPVSALPEWLTFRVGGFFREHPGFMAFAGLISVSVALIGVVAWGELSGALARRAPEVVDAIGLHAAHGSTASAPRARLSDAAAAGSTAPGVPAPEAEAPRAVVISAVDRALVFEAPALDRAEVRNVVAALATGVAPAAATQASVVGPPAPSATEVEALVASFVSAYESGRLYTFAGLFDDDARTDRRRGRPAIRREYEELFRLSAWRRMNLTQLLWYDVGDHIEARTEFTVRIGWHDGREVEEHVGVAMDLVRSGGRLVIARLSQQPR